MSSLLHLALFNNTFCYTRSTRCRPCSTLPCLTIPFVTRSTRCRPCSTLPGLTIPFVILGVPGVVLLHLTLFNNTFCYTRSTRCRPWSTLPCLTIPFVTRSTRCRPCSTLPCLTIPFVILGVPGVVPAPPYLV